MGQPQKAVLFLLAAVGLGVLLFWLSVRFRQPAVAPMPPPPAPIAEQAPGQDKRPLAPQPVQPAEPEVEAVAEPDTATVDSPEPATLADPDTFNEAELSQSHTRVMVDFGRYRVFVGEEVEIEVAVTAPALTNLFMVMEYDPELLAYVDGSASGRDAVFRHGIEFHADPKNPRLAVISAGLPGQKNTNEATSEIALSFRMLALAAGQTKLEFPPIGISFATGAGETIPYEIRGGTVTIREP